MHSGNTRNFSRMLWCHFLSEHSKLKTYYLQLFPYFRVITLKNMQSFKFSNHIIFSLALVICLIPAITTNSYAQSVGVGAKPEKGAEVFFDGSREMLDKKWTYWKGPRFAGELPIKW